MRVHSGDMLGDKKMTHELVLLRGGKKVWPTWLKIGLFRATDTKFRIVVKIRPLYLLYVYIPRLFKLWLSIEKDVISTCYLGFIKMPERK